MEIGGDLADKKLYYWKLVAIEGFMINLIGNRGKWNICSKFQRENSLFLLARCDNTHFSSCMMRQEGDNMVCDWNFGGCVEDSTASNLMNSVGCLISKYFFSYSVLHITSNLKWEVKDGGTNVNLPGVKFTGITFIGWSVQG